MKKKILSFIIGFALLVTILPSVLPTRAIVERSTQVSASAEVLYGFLSDLNQFSGWSPFQEMDPEQKTEVHGTGTGSYLSWQSKRMGEGVMTLEALEANKSIRVKMEFRSPMPGVGVSLWSLKPVSEGVTEVTWHFEQDLAYFQRYFGLMMNRMLGAHFEKGLQNLVRHFTSSP